MKEQDNIMICDPCLDHTLKTNLRKLAQYKELHPQPCAPTSIVSFGIGTHVFRKGKVRQIVHHLRYDSHKANGTEGCQSKVPKGQGPSPIPGVTFCKEWSADENHEPIQHNSQNGQPRGRHHPIANRDGIIVHLETAQWSRS